MLWGFSDEPCNRSKSRMWKKSVFPPTTMCGIADSKVLLEVCGILSSRNLQYLHHLAEVHVIPASLLSAQH